MTSFRNRKTRVVFGALLLSLLLPLGIASQAQAADWTLTQNSTWDTSTGDNTSTAASGDNINIVTFDLTISNLSSVNDLKFLDD